MSWFTNFFRANRSSSGIIVARVLEIQKHPNADRLRLVKLDTGSGIADPVVCGASNFNAGDNVALALPGAQILRSHHDTEGKPFVLEKAKIRGVESQGMICSAYELGLEDAPGEGIMVLDPAVKPGTPFSARIVSHR